MSTVLRTPTDGQPHRYPARKPAWGLMGAHKVHLDSYARGRVDGAVAVTHEPILTIREAVEEAVEAERAACGIHCDELVEAEREACAALTESLAVPWSESYREVLGIAEAIRARGKP